MDFNKIAGAVLVAGISALVISKVGNILVPATHFAHKGDDGTPGTKSAPAKPPMKFDEAIATAKLDFGKKQAKKCAACHSFTKGGANKVGPNLWNIVGRKKGANATFAYSSGMKNIGGTWTYEKLYSFLKNPAAVVKGTKMSFRMSKDNQRGAVIAYLRTLSDNPQALPKFVAPPKDAPPKDAPKKEATPGDKAPEKKDH